jgi:very-short-patch-repair endonuclease/predicted transcriptional regulator of viral defense system
MGACYAIKADRGHQLCKLVGDRAEEATCRATTFHLFESWMSCHYEMVTRRDIPDAVRNAKVAAVAEWHAAGLTRAELRSLVRSGELVRVWPAVYATRTAVAWAKASPPRDHALLAMAARTALGVDSVVSHHSAALIHGLDLFPAAPGPVTLTRSPARRCNRPKSDGVVFHTAELPAEHVTMLLGVRVTTVPRTVVDLARVSSFMSAVVTADSALRADADVNRADFTPKEALTAVCDVCAGWPGIRQARRAVNFSDPRAESVLESCARVTFHEHGLDPPELQFTVTGPDFRYSVDFYWPRNRVIAEADGAMKYSDPQRAIRQLDRDQRLRDLGYKVVHFTWRELFQNPAAVVDRIRRALASLALA